MKLSKNLELIVNASSSSHQSPAGRHYVPFLLASRTGIQEGNVRTAVPVSVRTKSFLLIFQHQICVTLDVSDVLEEILTAKSTKGVNSAQQPRDATTET